MLAGDSLPRSPAPSGGRSNSPRISLPALMQGIFQFIDSDQFPRVIPIRGLSRSFDCKFSFISFRRKQHGGQSLEF